MKVILHIGIHKTGTTAIQFFGTRNREALAQRGCLYPSVYTKFNAHHPLPWALGVRHPDRPEGVSPEAIAAAILDEAKAKNVDKILLSSEEFRNLERVPLLMQLKQLFADCETEVVIYLRRQDDFLVSKYGQHVRMYAIRYPSTILDFYLRHNYVARYNYWELTHRWAKAFGDEALRVKVYDKRLFPNGNVLEDFFQTIGVDYSGLDLRTDVDVNRNLHPIALEILRRLNAKKRLDEAEHSRMLVFLNGMDFSAFDGLRLLSDRNQNDLMGLFGHTNALVAKKWLHREDGVLFPETPGKNDNPERTLDTEMVINALLTCLLTSVKK
jgi:hypothetical protein